MITNNMLDLIAYAKLIDFLQELDVIDPCYMAWGSAYPVSLNGNADVKMWTDPPSRQLLIIKGVNPLKKKVI